MFENKFITRANPSCDAYLALEFRQVSQTSSKIRRESNEMLENLRVNRKRELDTIRDEVRADLAHLRQRRWGTDEEEQALLHAVREMEEERQLVQSQRQPGEQPGQAQLVAHRKHSASADRTNAESGANKICSSEKQ
jgi:hypothetical protein